MFRPDVLLFVVAHRKEIIYPHYYLFPRGTNTYTVIKPHLESIRQMQAPFWRLLPGRFTDSLSDNLTENGNIFTKYF